MDWIFPLLGVLVLLLLAWDMHSTVFVPRGEAGPLTRRVYMQTWRAWALLAGSRPLGSRVRLAQLGPLLVPFTVLLWVTLLLLAVVLFLLPVREGFSVHPGTEREISSWLMVLYVSIYSVSTLGVGDITPAGMYGRLVMAVGSAAGFALFTVSLTYLLNVYNALGRATTLALSITHIVGSDAETHSAQALRSALVHDEASRLRTWLSGLAEQFAGLVLARQQYPLVSYFYVSQERALPVASSRLLELITVAMTLLDPGEHPALVHGPFIRRTFALARTYLDSLMVSVPEDLRGVDEGELLARREQDFERAWTELAGSGVALRSREAAWRAYQQVRSEWDDRSQAILLHLGYERR